MKRRVITVLLAAVLSLSMVGCTKTVTTTVTEDGVTTTTTEVSDENGTSVTTTVEEEDLEAVEEVEEVEDVEEEADDFYEEEDYFGEYETLEDYYSVEENYNMIDAEVKDTLADNEIGCTAIEWSIVGNDMVYEYTIDIEPDEIEELAAQIDEKFENLSQDEIYAATDALVLDSGVTGTVSITYSYVTEAGDFIAEDTISAEY